MMKKIKGFFNIIRPVNILMTFLVFLVSIVICSDIFHFSSIVFWAGVAVILVTASGNIINDYYDFEIDLINRPQRPIPSNRITKNEALYLYSIILIISLIVSYSISINIFFIVLLTNILLFLYSKYLKRILLVGNIVIAFCTGLVFIFGGIVAGNLHNAVIPAVFAFLINLIREILKDMEDTKGDKQIGITTIPIKFGISFTRKIILILSLFLILLTFFPFVLHLYKIEYLIIILFLVNVPLVYFLRELYSNKYFNKLSKLSMVLKIIMIFGLVSIYVGAY